MAGKKQKSAHKYAKEDEQTLLNRYIENANSLQMYWVCNERVLLYGKDAGGDLNGKYNSSKSG